MKINFVSVVDACKLALLMLSHKIFEAVGK